MTQPPPGPDQWAGPSQAPYPDPSQRRSPFAGKSRLITTIVAALVVLVGAAASVWWFSGRGNQPNRVAGPAPHQHVPASTYHRPMPTTPDNSAYAAGTCLTEPVDPVTAGLELKPVSCAGNQAVLIINKVVAQYSDCQNSADYVNHGFLLVDEAANVTYCLSLVVPTSQCFEFSTDNSQPIQRATCGSGPKAVRVESIESAPNVGAACSDVTAPDIWYYQSPTSGQFACVSRQAPSSTTPTAPTSG